MEKKNIRLLSVILLREIDHKKSLQEVLDKAITGNNLNPQDAAFLTRILYGVTEKRLSLDYTIRHFSSLPFRKISIEILNVLRIGIYQLVFMDTPGYAAINESVDLVQKLRQTSAKGFVNAILRKVDALQKQLPLPEKKDYRYYLSIKYSVSQDIADIFIRDYGKKNAEEILKFFETQAPISVRVNTLKTTQEELLEQFKEEGVTAVANKELKNNLFLYNPGNITKLGSFQDGLFFVQDTSSQLAITLADPTNARTLLDVCAAPGGKTFMMHLLNDGIGDYYAGDKYKYKIEEMHKSAKRLNFDGINYTVSDATEANESLPLGDFVLCDVVCSGLGILRKKPEIRYKSKKEIENLPKIQYTILERTSQKVKPGGKLVYSTCTLNKKENEFVVETFLKNYPEFQGVPLNFQYKKLASKDNCHITFLPNETQTDGFFVAVFERK